LYGEGEEVDDGEGEGEGEEDFKGIEEEVFNASQSLRKKSDMNYTEIEDTCLVLAWSQVSIDGVTDSDQTEKRY
jgi:hypothetical protein